MVECRGLQFTITGVGKILAMVIMMEVGDIGRFEKVGNLDLTTSLQTWAGKALPHIR